MLLHEDILLYQIRQYFRKAELRNPGGNHVSGPMFWSTKKKMKDHIVLVRSDEREHFVHLYEGTLFLCLGFEPAGPASGNTYIYLPDENDAGQVFNVLLEIFDSFRSWRSDLEKSVSFCLSYPMIIRSTDRLVSHPFGLLDNSFRYISYSLRLVKNTGYDAYVSSGPKKSIPLEYINMLNTMEGFRDLENRSGIFEYTAFEDLLCRNIFFRKKSVGRLMITHTKDVCQDRYYRQILEILGSYVEKLYARIGSFSYNAGEETQLRNMASSLLEGKPVEQDILKRTLISQGNAEGDSYYLLQLRSQFLKSENMVEEALIPGLANVFPGSFCFSWQNRILVLLNINRYESEKGKTFKQELAVFLRDSLFQAGISRKFSDVLSLKAAYRQTEVALQMGPEIDSTYWYFNFDDYAYRYLLHQCCQDLLPEQVCDRSILILEEYDRANGTDLNHTLRTYIDCQYNAVEAARRLYIARGTFLKRMNRIYRLTDLNLEDSEKRNYITISYDICRLQDSISASAEIE